MNKYRKIVNYFLSLVIITAVYNTHKGYAQIILREKKQKSNFVFRTAFKYPYYNILDDRFQEAFKKLGFNVELILLPSQRALILSNREGDGEASRVVNLKELSPENTNNLLIVPEVIITSKLTVFVKTIDLSVKAWADLTPYSNGARIGAKIIEANLPGRRTFLGNNIQLFKMLNRGRLDTVVEWYLMGIKVINNLKLSGIKPLEPPLLFKNFYPFIHKKHKDLIPRIVRVLKEMKQDGIYHKLREQTLKEMGK